ncbi:MAG TPA: sugar ABC transporter permease [Candidatus Limnocylindria bacterium]|jgi:D-xylose transport system permease protein|nr:sugar ABC transporter permease [Candidatus Limnocylindria bacterium]
MTGAEAQLQPPAYQRVLGAIREFLRRIPVALRRAEIDTRLFGMLVALAIIWVGFNVVSDGGFLTARNLWNLSVQSASIGIMATGMVLVIVSRNIDLSVGSLLGFLGYTMAMVQIEWIPRALGLGFDQPYTWLVALVVGLVLGATLGAITGLIIGYGGVPSFIVTLGGLLVFRGLIFSYAQGQTMAPLDGIFRLLGGGPEGSLGETLSWAVGVVIAVAIVINAVRSRRRKRHYGFQVRPMWAEIALNGFAIAAVLGAVWVANAYSWPEALAAQFAEERGIPIPPGGLIIPTGIAYPVLILLAVTIVMTYVATRRRFGRNVYAMGGNPEAARLGGINTRKTIVTIFAVMGVLCAISAAVQTARLNAAVTGLGGQNELDVISAAVIGGTSFAGGIGSIPGAVLGAVVMQSLRSGMLLLNVDSPTQDIIVGFVLVIAVGLDAYLRRRAG